MGAVTVEGGSAGVRVAEAKLLPPRLHPGVVVRRALFELLDQHVERPLTLVRAGVGYGKTTLVRSWCAERPEPVMWVTLDAADNDPVRLWTHLATGLERIASGVGGQALTCLRGRAARVDVAVDELMNGLVKYGGPLTIVLDDLHTVTSEPSTRSIAKAIERLPAGVRVVALTRTDPQIGVARLRARRALIEVRTRDLVFTVDEAVELLRREQVELSRDSVRLLVKRTEGWPAGVYLAALWLRDLDDPDAGVRSFDGSTRDVGDYLTDEVLNALSPDLRDFLVRSAILQRLTPSLCDAVLGRTDSAAVLANLSRSNMFLVALDGRGEWYRYHHLFGEVLRLELGRDGALEPRRAAARWCVDQGLVEDAIEYASAADDDGMVAELVADHHLEFIWSGRLAQLLSWIRWLPTHRLAERPEVPVAGAVAAALLGRPPVEVRQLLAVAEGTRERHPALWTDYLEVGVALTHADAIDGGDVGAAVAHARRAVSAARRGAPVLTVGALASLAQGLFFADDTEGARLRALEAVGQADATQATNGYVAALGVLALVEAEHGRTQSAAAWAAQAIDFAHQVFETESWILTFAHLALARVELQRGALDPAERSAKRGELLRRTSYPTIGHAHALLVLAEVRIARSRLTAATNDLERARRMLAEFTDPGRLPALLTIVERELIAAQTGHRRELTEQPSPAEHAVLQALATGLSRREIGLELYISLNTVKSHTRELYRKLGVTSQPEAVARATALGLLTGSNHPGDM